MPKDYNAGERLEDSDEPWMFVSSTPDFVVRDSGERQEFDSGMVRDTQEGKINYTRIFDGVMADRWAAHLTLAEPKYPDIAPGVPNWTQANSPEEVQRFKVSAARHFVAWLNGETDEDHAAAIIFNIDGKETTQKKIEDKPIFPLSASPEYIAMVKAAWGELEEAVEDIIEEDADLLSKLKKVEAPLPEEVDPFIRHNLPAYATMRSRYGAPACICVDAREHSRACSCKPEAEPDTSSCLVDP